MLMLTFKVGAEAVGIDIRRLREVIPRVVLQPACGLPRVARRRVRASRPRGGR